MVVGLSGSPLAEDRGLYVGVKRCEERDSLARWIHLELSRSTTWVVYLYSNILILDFSAMHLGFCNFCVFFVPIFEYTGICPEQCLCTDAGKRSEGSKEIV